MRAPSSSHEIFRPWPLLLWEGSSLEVPRGAIRLIYATQESRLGKKLISHGSTEWVAAQARHCRERQVQGRILRGLNHKGKTYNNLLPFHLGDESFFGKSWGILLSFVLGATGRTIFSNRCEENLPTINYCRCGPFG